MPSRTKRSFIVDAQGNATHRKCQTCKEYLEISNFRPVPCNAFGVHVKCNGCDPIKHTPAKIIKNKKGKCIAKECVVCHEVKPSSEFNKINYSIGVTSKCTDCYNEMFRKRRLDSEVVEKERVRVQSWRKRNLSKFKVQCKTSSARRRVAHKNSVHPIKFKEEIKEVYQKATQLTEETGTLYCVDHIIPLVHPDVCGLHTPHNLQLLPFEENAKKTNKFDGTLENESWRKRHE